jgi:hypothetical protein
VPAFKGSKKSDDSVLPNFSADEQAYQQHAWESLIGCSIARSIVDSMPSSSKFPVSQATLSQKCSRFQGLFKNLCDKTVPLIVAGLKNKVM